MVNAFLDGVIQSRMNDHDSIPMAKLQNSNLVEHIKKITAPKASNAKNVIYLNNYFGLLRCLGKL